MFESLLLGAATLLSGQPTPFFEQPLELPEATFELSTDKPWNSLTVFTPDGKSLPKLSYKDTEGNWRDWEPEDDRDDLTELVFFDQPRTTLQIQSEETVQVIAHFFNTKIPGESLVAQFSDNTSDFLETSNESKKLLKKIPKYFLRADWGANESIRLADNFGRKSRKWFPIEQRLVEAKFRPVNIVEKNDEGETLYWPIAENQLVAKFVVHHTAENLKKERNRTPAELMRAIYSYHTITRGWGDIGYNFVIDRAGNVYEGRAGYERNQRIPVGAHVAYRNIGTVGIALMGNFQEEEPTESQLDVLALLIADLSEQIGSDPLGKTKFWGKTTANILGHRDITVRGRGTACPGKNMVKELPNLRKKVARVLEILDEFEDIGVPKGRDFLSKSHAAPRIQKVKNLTPERKGSPLEISIITDIPQIRRHERKIANIRVKNTSAMDWPAGTAFRIKNAPDGTIIEPFRTNDLIRHGRTGNFSSKINVKSNGTYHFQLVPQFLEKKYFPEQIERAVINYSFRVSGDTRLFRARADRGLFTKNMTASVISMPAPTPTATKKLVAPKPTTPYIKVKLAGFDASFAKIVGTKPVDVWHREKKLFNIIAGTPIEISYIQSTKTLFVKAGDKEWHWSNAMPGNISLKTNGVLRIENYRNPRFGQGKVSYNSFRRELHLYPQHDKLLIVNTLPLEEYLWGLGEEPSTEPLTKRHVIHILARSYAKAYSGTKRKFRTPLYDLEDDPRTSQLYLGYDWEQYHIEQKALIAETAGQVVTKYGKTVIAPYFTQSAGQSVNPWASQYPWCRVRDLPYDAGLAQRGHGVGLSGNTTRILAEQGKSIKEIIDYFFDGLLVKKMY